MKIPAIDAYKIDGPTAGKNAVKEITFVDFVSASSGADATSMSVVVPETVRAGDLLLIPAFRRADLTAPTGFEVIREIKNIYSGLDQYTLIYHKIATAADLGATLTFTYATSVRGGIGLIVLRSDTGFDIESYATATGLTVPTISATVDGSVIVVASSNVVTSSATYFQMYGERLLQASPIKNLADLRICAAFGRYNSGQALSATIINSSTTASVATVAAVIAPL